MTTALGYYADTNTGSFERTALGSTLIDAAPIAIGVGSAFLAYHLGAPMVLAVGTGLVMTFIGGIILVIGAGIIFGYYENHSKVWSV